MSGEEHLRVLELFSGIGGMHYALNASGVAGEVKFSVDINTTANKIYSYNHPDVTLLNNNIQKFRIKDIQKINVNTILMSPPCQPFTRNGNKKDVDDARTNALLHICKILPELETIEYILMENVKGFDTSVARDTYIEVLKKSGFEYQEFLLSPTQIGVPNARCRYYCLARRSKPFSFKADCILKQLPDSSTDVDCNTIESVLNGGEKLIKIDYAPFLLPDKILSRRAWLLDIKHPTDKTTNCFTKAYTHYIEGTGSVYTAANKMELDAVFAGYNQSEEPSDEQMEQLRSLKLRYFTPYEVARLMSFPSDFTFPNDTTNKQRYRVLGNSINVAVVGRLIVILCNDSRNDQ